MVSNRKRNLLICFILSFIFGWCMTAPDFQTNFIYALITSLASVSALYACYSFKPVNMLPGIIRSFIAITVVIVVALTVVLKLLPLMFAHLKIVKPLW